MWFDGWRSSDVCWTHVTLVWAAWDIEPGEQQGSTICGDQIPQTVLALKGFDGVAEEGAMVGLRIRSWTRSLIFAAISSTW